MMKNGRTEVMEITKNSTSYVEDECPKCHKLGIHINKDDKKTSYTCKYCGIVVTYEPNVDVS